MRVVIAVDKFAGTMSSPEAGNAIAEGWLSVRGNDSIVVVPMADGGPGTVDALAGSDLSETVTSASVDQYGEPVPVTWLLIGGQTAAMEAASVCGLHLSDRRSPLDGDTTGLGVVLRDISRRGIGEVIIGLGGSGTVDGGVGMARRLGARFDSDIRAVGPAPRWMDHITATSAVLDLGFDVVQLASDVSNPLLGPRGAARVFGPQKGASPDDVERLESGLTRVADIAERDLPGGPWRESPGAGAAGGLGFGAMAWLGAEVIGGADLVADRVGLDSAIAEADVVITGEGSADASTLEGKVPIVVRRRSGERPTLLVAGRITPEIRGHFDGWVELGDPGLTAPRDEARKAGALLAAGDLTG